MPEPTTPAELAVLAAQARLDLPEPYMDELLAAWRHVEAMAARIRRSPGYAEEPAHVFIPATYAREG